MMYLSTGVCLSVAGWMSQWWLADTEGTKVEGGGSFEVYYIERDLYFLKNFPQGQPSSQLEWGVSEAEQNLFLLS